jgi:FAD/FMN-containing dehydrogenase
VSDTIFTRLRALLGTTGVERDAHGIPRATPDTPDALSLVCRLAHEEGWKIRVEGRGTWLPPDAPADLVVSTSGLEQVVSVSPADLVATVQAGTPLEALRRRLADFGMWLALDPPGRPERSIGSIVATATAGPLRHGFGPVRDHVLGCSVATGDGRLVNAGGRVVKNVAGYDVTKLHVGGFGGFGIIAEIHLRLRALPRADVTLLARGTRDALTSAARDIVAGNLLPGALELLSPALAAEADWVLATRFVGTETAVQADVRRVIERSDLGPHTRRSDGGVLDCGGAG